VSYKKLFEQVLRESVYFSKEKHYNLFEKVLQQIIYGSEERAIKILSRYFDLEDSGRIIRLMTDATYEFEEETGYFDNEETNEFLDWFFEKY
jgi:hypothetical protein